MEIEENDGREPRPTSENQEISKEPTPQNKPERQRPAYRATREGGGYKLDSKGRPTPPPPPSTTKRRPRIKDSRPAGYNRIAYGSYGPAYEKDEYLHTSYSAPDNRPYAYEQPTEGVERKPYVPQSADSDRRRHYASYPQGGERPERRRPFTPREGYGERPHRPHGPRQAYGEGESRPAGPFPPKKKVMMKKKKPKKPVTPFIPEQVKYEEQLSDPNEPIRLNRFLANSGVCSRREADTFIQAGVVQVNGEVVTTLGTKITRQDEVLFRDQPVHIESKIYILLNKPKNCMTTVDDPQNRRTVMDLVKNACPERIYPIGRLDRNTTGVLLLTNDGNLASKLTHPSFKKKKIYHVWLDKEVAVEDMEKLASGLVLDDGEIHADAISYASEEDHKQVGIEIHSGRNRIVRRMFEALGYHVTKLDRVYFAGLTKKNLGRGKWRYLNEQEVNMLRMGAFE